MAKRLIVNPLLMFWHLVKNDAQRLELDPEVQWRYHRKMSWYWVCNFPVVIVMFFFFPSAWIKIGLLLNTFYSLYANFATEFGAIPSSYGAMNTEKMARAVSVSNDDLSDQLDGVATNVQDIQQVTDKVDAIFGF
jgi:hypothetical protein